MAARSWKFILTSSPETKGYLTPNLVGSIRVTCRSKIAKIILIGNQRWPPSWKSILNFFSRSKRSADLKLCRKYRKQLKSFRSETQDGWHLATLFFKLLLLNQRAIDWKTGRKYRGDLLSKGSSNLPNQKPKIADILKIYFELLLLNRKANRLETCLVLKWAIQGHLGPLVLAPTICSYTEEHCCAHICFVYRKDNQLHYKNMPI